MAGFEPFWGISARKFRAKVLEAIFPLVRKELIIGVHLGDQNVSLTYNGTMYAPRSSITWISLSVPMMSLM